MKVLSAAKFILLLLVWAAIADDATNVLSVCSSGCGFRSVQAAIDAAKAGDVVELKAGERFVESVHIGTGKDHITLRSSRYQQLPGAGYRVRHLEDAAFLATIASPNNEPTLQIGAEQNVMAQNGLDLATGRIKFEWAPPFATLSNGKAVACYGRDEFLVQMPAPLEKGRKYWVRDWDLATRSGRLSETPNGPAIQFTKAGSAGEANYYGRPACTLWDQPRDVLVTGIRFEPNNTGNITRNVVVVGHNAEPDPVQMGPFNIRFEHTVISGAQNNPNGPLFCLSLFGGHQLLVADSWLGHCKQVAGNESKAIGIQNVSDLVIRNNYISAASINLLTGGGDSASGDVNRDIVITGNFFEKPGYMMYKDGVGAPTGSCYYGGGSGAYYRRTDVTPNTSANGASYTCQPNGAWALDTTATYRESSYLTKNLLELKDCENCRVEGNFFRGSYAGPDSGQGWCYGVSVGVSAPGMAGFGSGYHRARHVTIRDNHGDYCYSGIVVGNSAYGGKFLQVPIEDVAIENNLLTNYGWFPAMSQFPQANSVNRYGLKQSGGNQDVRFVNNTIRGRSEGSYAGVVFYDGRYDPVVMNNYRMANNIFHYKDYTVLVDGRAGNCTPAGLTSLIPFQNAKRLTNNVFYAGDLDFIFLEDRSCTSTLAAKNFVVKDDNAVGFVSESDSRLKETSSFSAANSKAKALSDDGSSLGADVDLIEQYTIPAMKGTPPAPALIGLTVRTGSRQAVLRYQRPEGVMACQVTLYSGPRLSKASVPDTLSPANQQDGRASSAVAGRQVQFVAGAVTPLLPGRAYAYQIQCGSMRVLGRLQMLNESSEAPVLKQAFSHTTAKQVRIEFGISPSLDNPTPGAPTAFSGGKALVNQPLPKGYHYWRAVYLGVQGEPVLTGPTEVFVSP